MYSCMPVVHSPALLKVEQRPEKSPAKFGRCRHAAGVIDGDAFHDESVRPSLGLAGFAVIVTGDAAAVTNFVSGV